MGLGVITSISEIQSGEWELLSGEREHTFNQMLWFEEVCCERFDSELSLTHQSLISTL